MVNKKELKLSNGEVVEMAEPNVRVFRNAMAKEGGEIAQSIALIAALTNKQESEIEELHLKDFKILQDTLKDFLQEAGFIEPKPAV